MAVETREVSRFDRLRFRGPGTVKLMQGDTESLTIHAPAYMMRNIESEVRDGKLHLGYVSPRITSMRAFKEVISYQLVMKDIRGIVMSGSGKITAPDIDNDAIGLQLSGSGSIVFEHLTADRFAVEIGGSGRVTVQGDVEAQHVVMSGSGQYEAEKLVSDFAHVKMSGSGNAHVSVSDDLNVEISGSGRVSYAGYPDISKRISGSGALLRRRRDKRPVNRGENNG